jgi:hypothetical protein
MRADEEFQGAFEKSRKPVATGACLVLHALAAIAQDTPGMLAHSFVMVSSVNKLYNFLLRIC